MKNLAKIFMAVAVAMFAFSCVNDATEDIAVKVGGKTTLTLSLENTRTQLGEAADGVYPITWAEGDQITVNGVTSDELTSTDGAGTANAVFTFNTELSAPYCVAYPAAEANQVVFAAEQEYVEGTFASGAATMYGYATNGNITLNHLTGVLKIGVVCGAEIDPFDAPKVQTVKISTIDRAPIAGAFNINFETGVVTPTAEATSVISYDVDMKLNQDPTYLHIAVPAGVYNELYVTLEDNNGGVMYATVKANNDKPLAAGNVREFTTPIVYVATDEEKSFVVSDYASLHTVKEVIEEAESMGDTAVLAKDILFVADVDINPAVETAFGVWSPIDAPNYTGAVKGNGYAVTGLTAPLFGTVGVKSIKGLHLEDLTIAQTFNESTSEVSYGALACEITNPDVEVANCSASGAMTIVGNNPGKHCVVAGLIGKVAIDNTAAKFTNLVNKVNVSVSGSFAGAADIYTSYIITGCVGWTNGALTNCQNLGNISSSATYAGGLYMSGVAGVSGNITSCFNGMKDKGDKFGVISFTGTAKSLSYFSGIFSSGRATNPADTSKGIDFAKREEVKNCVNYGNLIIGGTHSKESSKALYPSIGGIAGVCNAWKLDSCDNYGDITVTMTVVDSGSNSSVAGIGSSADLSTSDLSINYNVQAVSNCKNYGAIEIKNTSFAGALHVGGIFNRASLKLTNVSNLYNYGPITITDISNVGGEFNVSGILGYIEVAAAVTNLENAETGDITLKNVVAASKTDVAGIIGYVADKKSTITTATNKGDIALNEVTVKSSYLNVGGIAGYNGVADSVYKDLTNEGHITLIECVAKNNFDLGGVMGTITKNFEFKGNIVNKGKIYCNVEATAQNTGVAGIVGMYNQQKITMTDATLLNTGDIKCEGGKYKNLGAGGIFGRYTRNNCENATNTGNVFVAVDCTEGIFVGGIVGGKINSSDFHVVKNSKCFCDVVGYKWDGQSEGDVTPANIGMVGTSLVAINGSNVDVVNCKIGGRLFKGGKVVKNGDKYELQAEYFDLDGDNFYKYIMLPTTSPTEKPAATMCSYWNGK